LISEESSAAELPGAHEKDSQFLPRLKCDRNRHDPFPAGRRPPLPESIGCGLIEESVSGRLEHLDIPHISIRIESEAKPA
jgi:hypothetical protein